MQRLVAPLLCAGLTTACSSSVEGKLEALALSEASRAAISRLRFARLHKGDRIEQGEIVVCGEGDQVLLGFSHKLVAAYLGRDAEWLMPELFSRQAGKEVLLAVPAKQLMRLELPRGIGTDARHPVGWARELAGSPLWTGDLRAIGRLFADDEVQELFALRSTAPAPAPARQVAGRPWRLGVQVYPRMGPRSGVMIAAVVKGSPAARAGLAKGDRILAVGDISVSSFRELKAATRASTGSLILLTVLRSGAREPESLAVNVQP